MTREFTCELHGLVLPAENDEDLAVQVERHIAEAHPELIRKGDVAAGDQVRTVALHPARIAIAEITRLYASNQNDVSSIEPLVALDALPDDWRRYFAKRLGTTTRTRASTQHE